MHVYVTKRGRERACVHELDWERKGIGGGGVGVGAAEIKYAFWWDVCI